jgi:protein TIF31
MRYLQDLKNFYYSLNCIVQYKGLRVHAQVVTPGVIFNSEHLVEYGESEDGLIKSNKEFLDEYRKLCEKLNIRDITVVDKNSQEHEIIGHPEIKGVRGVDKRRYLFDLIHLFPRDLNFIGPDCNGCLLRPELIRDYQLKLIFNKISSEYQDEMKKINEIDNTLIKDPKAYVTYIEEKYKQKEELFEKINNEIKPMVQLDNTLFTEHKYFTFINKHKEEDEKLLRELARYLKEDVLNKFLTEITKEEEMAPSDCFSLTESLHKNGISVRYYGELLRIIDNDASLKKQACWMKTLVIRDIIRRCAKHIYNSLTIDIPEYLTKHFTAYFLNLLLSPSSLIKLLEQQEVVYSNGNVISQKQVVTGGNNVTTTASTTSSVQKENPADKKKKKNKNKKKKTNKPERDVEIEFFITENLTSKNIIGLFEPKGNEKYFIKPSNFWSQIRDIALKRFGFTFPQSSNFEYIDPAINKFGLLRDICLTIGIQIESLDYQLYYDTFTNKNDFKYLNMPFKGENIVSFFPVVKDFKLPSEVHRPIFEQAESFFKGGNFLDAAEKYRQILYISNEVYGSINHFAGVAHKRLAEIAYLEGDYLTAISLVQKSIIVNEKLFNYDTNIVANSYAELSTYYHLIGQDYLAFKHLFRSLEIINFTYPKNVTLVINTLAS